MSTQRHRNAPSPRHHRRPVLSARAPLAPHLARRVALLAERVDVKEDLPILARERREVEIRLGASSPERLRERRGVRLPVVVIVGEGEGRDEWVRGVALQRLLQRGRMLKLGQVRIRQLEVGEPKCLGRAGRKSGGGVRLSVRAGISMGLPERTAPKRVRWGRWREEAGPTAFWAFTKFLVSWANESSRCLEEQERKKRNPTDGQCCR